MLAQVSGMEPFELLYSVGDCHIYKDQLEQAKEQLARTPFDMPTLHVNPDVTDFFKFSEDDFALMGYRSHPTIKYNVAT